MPMLSNISKGRLCTCDPRLVRVMNLAIQRIDFSVSCGHRGEAEQNAAFATGASAKRWPQSKHNKLPSLAIDILPYPFKDAYWKDKMVWKKQADVVLACAAELGVPMRWGGDWDMDGDISDERLFDGPHFELII